MSVPDIYSAGRSFRWVAAATLLMGIDNDRPSLKIGEHKGCMPQKNKIGGILLCLCLSYPVAATDYIYRELMADTLPAHCDTANKAKAWAKKNYKITNSSKRFCQTQGYGWHLDEIKTVGTTVCAPCAGAPKLQQCHQEDIVVACKRIRPGTVGLLQSKDNALDFSKFTLMKTMHRVGP